VWFRCGCTATTRPNSERPRRLAEARAAGSPGAGSAERPIRGYSIEVHRIEFDEQDEDEGVWWGAEAGFSDDSVGDEYESCEDLAALLGEVVEDVRVRWGSRYDVRVEWTLTGSPVALAEAAAAVGFELPDRLDGP